MNESVDGSGVINSENPNNSGDKLNTSDFNQMDTCANSESTMGIPTDSDQSDVKQNSAMETPSCSDTSDVIQESDIGTPSCSDQSDVKQKSAVETPFCSDKSDVIQENEMRTPCFDQSNVTQDTVCNTNNPSIGRCSPKVDYCENIHLNKSDESKSEVQNCEKINFDGIIENDKEGRISNNSSEDLQKICSQIPDLDCSDSRSEVDNSLMEVLESVDNSTLSTCSEVRLCIKMSVKCDD
jgi:hypothetical protein